MPLDGPSQDLVDLLQQQPHGVELRWHSDHLSIEQPWAAGWVDIISADLQVDYNWSWTITWADLDDVVEDGGYRPDAWEFQWPPDLCIYRVWEHDWDWGDEFVGPDILSIPVELGAGLTEEQAEALNQAQANSSPDAAVYGIPGWSPAAISAALEFWAEVYAGRDDLTFRWDTDGPPSPMFLRAEATLAALHAGDIDAHTIAELSNGWTLKEPVHDWLLDFEVDDD